MKITRRQLPPLYAVRLVTSAHLAEWMTPNYVWTQTESSQKLAVVDKDKPSEQQLPLQLGYCHSGTRQLHLHIQLYSPYK